MASDTRSSVSPIPSKVSPPGNQHNAHLPPSVTSSTNSLDTNSLDRDEPSTTSTAPSSLASESSVSPLLTTTQTPKPLPHSHRLPQKSMSPAPSRSQSKYRKTRNRSTTPLRASSASPIKKSVVASSTASPSSSPIASSSSRGGGGGVHAHTNRLTILDKNQTQTFMDLWLDPSLTKQVHPLQHTSSHSTSTEQMEDSHPHPHIVSLSSAEINHSGVAGDEQEAAAVSLGSVNTLPPLRLTLSPKSQASTNSGSNKRADVTSVFSLLTTPSSPHPHGDDSPVKNAASTPSTFDVSKMASASKGKATRKDRTGAGTFSPSSPPPSSPGSTSAAQTQDEAEQPGENQVAEGHRYNERESGLGFAVDESLQHSIPDTGSRQPGRPKKNKKKPDAQKKEKGVQNTVRSRMSISHIMDPDSDDHHADEEDAAHPDLAGTSSITPAPTPASASAITTPSPTRRIILHTSRSREKDHREREQSRGRSRDLDRVHTTPPPPSTALLTSSPYSSSESATAATDSVGYSSDASGHSFRMEPSLASLPTSLPSPRRSHSSASTRKAKRSSLLPRSVNAASALIRSVASGNDADCQMASDIITTTTTTNVPHSLKATTTTPQSVSSPKPPQSSSTANSVALSRPRRAATLRTNTTASASKSLEDKTREDRKKEPNQSPSKKAVIAPETKAEKQGKGQGSDIENVSEKTTESAAITPAPPPRKRGRPRKDTTSAPSASTPSSNPSTSTPVTSTPFLATPNTAASAVTVALDSQDEGDQDTSMMSVSSYGSKASDSELMPPPSLPRKRGRPRKHRRETPTANSVEGGPASLSLHTEKDEIQTKEEMEIPSSGGHAAKTPHLSSTASTSMNTPTLPAKRGRKRKDSVTPTTGPRKKIRLEDWNDLETTTIPRPPTPEGRSLRTRQRASSEAATTSSATTDSRPGGDSSEPTDEERPQPPSSTFVTLTSKKFFQQQAKDSRDQHDSTKQSNNIKREDEPDATPKSNSTTGKRSRTTKTPRTPLPTPSTESTLTVSAVTSTNKSKKAKTNTSTSTSSETVSSPVATPAPRKVGRPKKHPTPSSGQPAPATPPAFDSTPASIKGTASSTSHKKGSKKSGETTTSVNAPLAPKASSAAAVEAEAGKEDQEEDEEEVTAEEVGHYPSITTTTTATSADTSTASAKAASKSKSVASKATPKAPKASSSAKSTTSSSSVLPTSSSSAKAQKSKGKTSTATKSNSTQPNSSTDHEGEMNLTFTTAHSTTTTGNRTGSAEVDATTDSSHPPSRRIKIATGQHSRTSRVAAVPANFTGYTTQGSSKRKKLAEEEDSTSREGDDLSSSAVEEDIIIVQGGPSSEREESRSSARKGKRKSVTAAGHQSKEQLTLNTDDGMDVTKTPAPTKKNNIILKSKSSSSLSAATSVPSAPATGTPSRSSSTSKSKKKNKPTTGPNMDSAMEDEAHADDESDTLMGTTSSPQVAEEEEADFVMMDHDDGKETTSSSTSTKTSAAAIHQGDSTATSRRKRTRSTTSDGGVDVASDSSLTSLSSAMTVSAPGSPTLLARKAAAETSTAQEGPETKKRKPIIISSRKSNTPSSGSNSIVSGGGLQALDASSDSATGGSDDSSTRPNANARRSRRSTAFSGPTSSSLATSSTRRSTTLATSFSAPVRQRTMSAAIYTMEDLDGKRGLIIPPVITFQDEIGKNPRVTRADKASRDQYRLEMAMGPVSTKQVDRALTEQPLPLNLPHSSTLIGGNGTITSAGGGSKNTRAKSTRQSHQPVYATPELIRASATPEETRLLEERRGRARSVVEELTPSGFDSVRYEEYPLPDMTQTSDDGQREETLASGSSRSVRRRTRRGQPTTDGELEEDVSTMSVAAIPTHHPTLLSSSSPLKRSSRRNSATPSTPVPSHAAISQRTRTGPRVKLSPRKAAATPARTSSLRATATTIPPLRASGITRASPLTATTTPTPLSSSSSSRITALSALQSHSARTLPPPSFHLSMATPSPAAGFGGRGGSVLENDDFCSACGLGGELVCCDSCPKAFHFICIDAVPIEELPDEWNCMECKRRMKEAGVVVVEDEKAAPSVRGLSGVFGQLISNVHNSNPKAFRLPEDIQTRFEGVRVGADGSYEEITAKPSSRRDRRSGAVSGGGGGAGGVGVGVGGGSGGGAGGGGAGGAGQDDVPDFYKLRESNGTAALCHACQQSSERERPVITCSVCTLTWHIDCLEVPQAVPPVVRTWRCPIHVDAEGVTQWVLGPAHKYRRVKGQEAVKPLFSRGNQNNGIIVIDEAGYDEDFFTEQEARKVMEHIVAREEEEEKEEGEEGAAEGENRRKRRRLLVQSQETSGGWPVPELYGTEYRLAPTSIVRDLQYKLHSVPGYFQRRRKRMGDHARRLAKQVFPSVVAREAGVEGHQQCGVEVGPSHSRKTEEYVEPSRFPWSAAEVSDAEAEAAMVLANLFREDVPVLVSEGPRLGSGSMSATEKMDVDVVEKGTSTVPSQRLVELLVRPSGSGVGGATTETESSVEGGEGEKGGAASLTEEDRVQLEEAMRRIQRLLSQ